MIDQERRPDQCPRSLYVPGAPGWLRGATNIECRLREGHEGVHRAPFFGASEVERDEMTPDTVSFLGPAEAAVTWESDERT